MKSCRSDLYGDHFTRLAADFQLHGPTANGAILDGRMIALGSIDGAAEKLAAVRTAEIKFG
jgi:hypothetical protein